MKLSQNLTFFIFTMLSISIIGCTENILKNDWTEHKLLGKVKKLDEMTYEATDKFGKPVKTKSLKHINITFDANGCSKEFLIFGDNLLKNFKSVSIYDNKRNLIESNTYQDDGSLTNKFIYIYDDKGKLIEMDNYDKEGNLKFKTTYKYDKKGNKNEEYTYTNDGSLLSKYIFKNDDRGNRIEWCDYDYQGNLNNKATYKYDHKNNPIEYSRFSDGRNLSLKSTYKFDNNSNLIEELDYNPDGNLDSSKKHIYELDKKGNWIRKITFENDTPTTITEREITYF